MALFWSLVLWVVHTLFRFPSVLSSGVNRVRRHTQGQISYTTVEAKFAPLREQLPGSVCFAINEDALSYADLCKLVLWSAAAGVRFITVWDYRGQLKTNETLLLEYIQRTHTQLSQSHDRKFCIVSGVVSGEDDASTLQVLGPDSGRSSIVKATIALSTKNCSEITVDDLDQQLKLATPDPQLVVLFGENECLYSLLPWQLRLSEIVNVPTHRHLCLQTLHQAYHKFSKCQQRFGK
eukprot:m.103039 g.103039  ORF g.103039 m.103039 type:complete len:236 (+) comp18810_c0_seq1:52-759(+)